MTEKTPKEVFGENVLKEVHDYMDGDTYQKEIEKMVEVDEKKGTGIKDWLAYLDSDEHKQYLKEERIKRNKELDEHEDNGKIGWWVIRGIRHSALAKASNAREAVEKAIKEEVVGDWESGYPSFFSKENELPDAFRI